jgi:MoaA/NifB/PqqE/SkfB family radical SAM enzyme
MQVQSTLAIAGKLRAAYEKLRQAEAHALLLRPRVLLNAARNALETERRPLVMRSQPAAIEIELTNRCNLACTQCLRSQGLKPYRIGDLKLADYKRILAQFPLALSICLNGFGEPLMHAEFFEIVAHTRATLPWSKIVIYSNGTRLDRDVAARLIGSGLTEINVSIDAAQPDTYRKVRRGGNFTVVHENIRGLLAARRAAKVKLPLVGVNYVMVNDNEGELVGFLEQAAELGVDFVNCVSYATYDWGFQNLRTAESYRAELRQARARLAELGLKCRSFPAEGLTWAKPGAAFDCSFFWSDLRVTHEGEITLGCCTPFKETFSYGNLLETPFSEIWNGPLFRRNRELALRQQPPTVICKACKQQEQQFFMERDPALVQVRRQRVTPPSV